MCRPMEENVIYKSREVKISVRYSVRSFSMDFRFPSGGNGESSSEIF